MHPLTTQETQLTDALNATFVTFNGNEMLLQNDMGNTTILDNEGHDICLTKGFVPVGMKLHGGILYIASVNKDGVGELGTIPSPKITFEEQYTENINTTEKINDILNVVKLFQNHINVNHGEILDKTLLLNNTLYYGLIDNNIKLSDTIVKLGDSYVIYLQNLSMLVDGSTKPLISTFQLNGACNNDGWFNVYLKSKPSNSNLPINVNFTTLYDNNYWFTLQAPDDNFVYQRYPNIPRGKLMLDISLNLPTEVTITLPEYQEVDTEQRYVCKLPDLIITHKNYNGPLTIDNNYIKVTSNNNATIQDGYLYIKDSGDLTVELEISCYHNDIELGIYRIKYNPVRQIVDNVNLIPATSAVQQYYDALDINANIYDELNSDNYFVIPREQTAEYLYSYAHLLAKNGTYLETEIKDGEYVVKKVNDGPICFIPGAAYVDNSPTTPIVANYAEQITNRTITGYYAASTEFFRFVAREIGGVFDNEIVSLLYKGRERHISNIEHLLENLQATSEVKALLNKLGTDIFINSLPGILISSNTAKNTVETRYYGGITGDPENDDTYTHSTRTIFQRTFAQVYNPDKLYNAYGSQWPKSYSTLDQWSEYIVKDMSAEMLIMQALAIISEIGFLYGNQSQQKNAYYVGIVPHGVALNNKDGKEDKNIQYTAYKMYKLPFESTENTDLSTMQNCLLYDHTEYNDNQLFINGGGYNVNFYKYIPVFTDTFTQNWNSINYLFSQTPNLTIQSDHQPTLLAYTHENKNNTISIKFNGEEKTVTNSGFVKFKPFSKTINLEDFSKKSQNIKRAKSTLPRLDLDIANDTAGISSLTNTYDNTDIKSEVTVNIDVTKGDNYNYAWAFSSNLNLSASLNGVPQSGKATMANTKVYPQWNFDATQNTDYNGNIVNVDYTKGWEFNVDDTKGVILYTKTRTINIQYASLNTNPTLDFNALSSGEVNDKYAVIFNGFADENIVSVVFRNTLDADIRAVFTKNNTLAMVDFGSTNFDLTDITVNVLQINTSEINYVRNIGIYKITDPSVTNVSNVIVKQCICFEEDNVCGFKTYKMKHYSNDPRIQTKWWYKISNDRTEIIPNLNGSSFSDNTAILMFYNKIKDSLNITSPVNFNNNE